MCLRKTFTNVKVSPASKFVEFNRSSAVLLLVPCDHDLEFGFSIAFFTPCPFHTYTHTHIIMQSVQYNHMSISVQCLGDLSKNFYYLFFQLQKTDLDRKC